MGEVIEVGAENKKLKIGDRVVVPFTIACGECFFCKRGFYSGCERSNPDRQKAEKLQFAIRSAFLLGAERVLAIDTVPERMALARAAGAQTLDFKAEDIYRS
jgi:threonine dehydrogenase-like Zn-dependent dehydrogenase